MCAIKFTKVIFLYPLSPVWHKYTVLIEFYNNVSDYQEEQSPQQRHRLIMQSAISAYRRENSSAI